jgi:autotransporter translocation and assembly factor TamB
VSVTQDQSGGGSREVQVQYYATPKWTFETSTTTEGDSGADVFWQTKY